MTPATNLWLVIGVVGIATFLLRSSFIFGNSTRGRSDNDRPAFANLLRHVPTAALAALVTSAVLSPPAGGAGVAPRVLALILGGLVAWRTRSVLLTLAAGMIGLWLLERLL